MSFAALSTVIAVFENLISFSMDKWEISRRRAVAINGILVLVLSLPCALGFNVLSGVTIPAIGDIQSIEDFIVSNNAWGRTGCLCCSAHVVTVGAGITS